MNLGSLILSFAIVVFGGYLLYNVYKKPSPMSSTNFKGVIGGLGSIYLGFMGLINKIDLIQIFKDIFNIK